MIRVVVVRFHCHTTQKPKLTFIIMESCLCSVIDDFFLLRKQKVKLHFLKFRPAGFCHPGFYHRFFSVRRTHRRCRTSHSVNQSL